MNFKVHKRIKNITSFIGFVLLTEFFNLLVEPGIQSYGDSLQFCFTAVTRIGFGDFTATTLIGRIIIVVIVLYGIIVIALIPGVLVSYFTEIMKMKSDESMMLFLDKLEHLSELSKEELKKQQCKLKCEERNTSNRKFPSNSIIIPHNIKNVLSTLVLQIQEIICLSIIS